MPGVGAPHAQAREEEESAQVSAGCQSSTRTGEGGRKRKEDSRASDTEAPHTKVRKGGRGKREEREERKRY